MTAEAPSEHATSFAFEGTASAIASARRAALADRYAIESLVVEWRPLLQLQSIAEEWRALAARALSPNVFYEPAFALAAAPVFGDEAGAVLVWSGETPRRLLGLFPAFTQTRRYGIKLPVLLAWTHPYAPLGTPLVEGEAAGPVIAAWLAHLAADHQRPGLLLMPFVPEDGPFAAALMAILRRAQMPWAAFNRHRRAMLAPSSGGRSEYLRSALSRRKLQQLRRLGRRLSEQGAVLFTAATREAAVVTAAEDFLMLEAGGWKGRAGTAAAQHAATGAFVRTALRAMAAEGKVCVKRIFLDGAAIAAAVILRSADCAWFWKIAYDEQFAHYSPGVLVTLAVTEDLLDDGRIAAADSCAPADHPMIDHIWRERLPLCDLLIGLRPQAPFWRARQLETLRLHAIHSAKALRDRLHRR